jgi:two-component system cell cycle sensor histidine kinase/response regulator CckA
VDSGGRVGVQSASSMGGDGPDDEVACLRQRVQELEAALAKRELRADAGELAFLPTTLHAREATLADAERVAQLGTWVWDTRTERVSWSPELYRILGYDPASVTPSVEAFFAAVHPLDVDRVRARSSENVARGSVGETFACRIVQPSGVIRDVVLDGIPIRAEDGGVLGFAGTVFDVTERLARERALIRTQAMLTEAQRIAHTGSWVWDIATDSIEWSSELYRITGVPEGTPPSRELWRSRVHPDDLSLSAIREDLGPEATFTIDLRLVRTDGAVRTIRITSAGLVDESGKRVGYVGTVHDVTEQRALEEQLRQSQKMEAVGRVAAGVAHDFNNVLTVIRGGTDMMLARGDQSEELRQMVEACEQATRLTRLLLSFGQRTAFERREIAFDREVEQSVRLVRSMLGDRYEVEVDVSGPIWPIHGDAVQVHQIVSNLVLNARDAMPDGGTISVKLSNRVLDDAYLRTHAGARPGEYVMLEVCDGGIGMTDEVRTRAIEPFFTTKEPGRGTGLGLSTVFGIVRQRSGSLDIESTLGRGTSVRVYLPRT